MNRLLRLFLITVFCLSMCLCTYSAFAAGTVTIARDRISLDRSNQWKRVVLTLSWTADAADATVPATAIAPLTYDLKGWYLYSAETNPGDTAPTDGYNVTLVDADGVDVAGGRLTGRSESTSQLVVGFGANNYPVFYSTWTFTLVGNAVNSATGTLLLTFVSD